MREVKVRVLPGISFTVIFPGYNIFKQLATGDSNENKNKNVGGGVVRKGINICEHALKGERGALTGQR